MTTYGDDQVKRREFISASRRCDGAAAWPVMARAHLGQPAKRIGVLDLGNVDAQSLQDGAARGVAQERLHRRTKHRIRVPFGERQLYPVPSSRLSWSRSRSMSSRGALHTLCASGAKQATRSFQSSVCCRRSRRTGSSRKPRPAGRQHHRHLSHGGGVARQMRGAVSRHGFRRCTAWPLSASDGSILETMCYESSACGPRLWALRLPLS